MVIAAAIEITTILRKCKKKRESEEKRMIMMEYHLPVMPAPSASVCLDTY